jgi:hypothetical protein
MFYFPGAMLTLREHDFNRYAADMLTKREHGTCMKQEVKVVPQRDALISSTS